MTIGNQIITLLPSKTIIEIDYSGKHKNFKHELKFNLLKDFITQKEIIKTKNIAEYYWLANLYNSIIQIKNSKQLKLF